MGRLVAGVVAGVVLVGSAWAATLDIEGLERLKKRSEAPVAHRRVGVRALELIGRLIQQEKAKPAAEPVFCALDTAPAPAFKNPVI